MLTLSSSSFADISNSVPLSTLAILELILVFNEGVHSSYSITSSPLTPSIRESAARSSLSRSPDRFATVLASAIGSEPILITSTPSQFLNSLTTAFILLFIVFPTLLPEADAVMQSSIISIQTSIDLIFIVQFFSSFNDF